MPVVCRQRARLEWGQASQMAGVRVEMPRDGRRETADRPRGGLSHVLAVVYTLEIRPAVAAYEK